MSSQLTGPSHVISSDEEGCPCCFFVNSSVLTPLSEVRVEPLKTRARALISNKLNYRPSCCERLTVFLTERLLITYRTYSALKDYLLPPSSQGKEQ